MFKYKALQQRIRPLLFKIYTFTQFPYLSRNISFCRMLAKGPGHRKGPVKHLEVLWLEKCFLEIWRQSFISLCLKAFFSKLLLYSLQSKAQDLGSRKGLLPAGTPTSRASLQAFCMQYCWSSAAAWETMILSTPASSLSCSTRRCKALTLAPEDMAASWAPRARSILFKGLDLRASKELVSGLQMASVQVLCHWHQCLFLKCESLSAFCLF